MNEVSNINNSLEINNTDTKAWYVVQSKPQQEFVAVENLIRQGYHTYLPKISLRKKRKGKFINSVEPLFPRYLFIHLSSEADNWGPIRSTIGVSGLVRFGINVARVPDRLIQELMGRENEEGLQPQIDQDLVEGDKVLISEGPFEGYEAIYKVKKGNDRALVMLNIAEKCSMIKISQSALDKLS